MLTHLRIENLAIIEESAIAFEPGLNVLTGETGAGKSIIIGALNLILGERAAGDAVRSGARRARVEAIFHLADAPRTRALLDEKGLLGDDPDELIIRREILAAGKSRHFVNSAAVQLSELRDITAPLVDLHGQHQHQGLFHIETHRLALDAYGDYGDLVEQCAALYGEMSDLRRRLSALETDERQMERERDMAQYQMDEIEKVDPQPGEDDELAAERARLANADALIRQTLSALDMLYEGERSDTSALQLLSAATSEIEALSRIDPKLQAQVEALQSARASLEDVAYELRSYADGIEANPARQQEVEDRLDLIRKLKRKYGATIEEVLAERDRLQEQLDSITHNAEERETLGRRLAEAEGRLGAVAGELSDRRQETGRRWAEEMEARLAELAMPSARFAVDVRRTASEKGVPLGDGRYAVHGHGVDEVEFLIATNPGEDLRPLRKVASGGELSRVMLALKSMMAVRDQASTLVFDEIDAGVSGATAERVGRQIEALARGRQILCITHLPQIAARGTIHFAVEKVRQGARHISRVRRLSDDQRLDAIAALFSGDRPTPEGRDHARALMDGR